MALEPSTTFNYNRNLIEYALYRFSNSQFFPSSINKTKTMSCSVGFLNL